MSTPNKTEIEILRSSLKTLEAAHAELNSIASEARQCAQRLFALSERSKRIVDAIGMAEKHADHILHGLN